VSERGEYALTPNPPPTGRGELDSLSLRERARVRDKSRDGKMRWRGNGETLTPNRSPTGREEE